MKKQICAVLMAVLLAGCGAKASSGAAAPAASAPVVAAPANSSAPAEPAPKPEETAPAVDIDLTVLNANMVYAQVFQMVQDPQSYVGRRVKLEGEYYSAPGPEKIYLFAYMSDAAACCSQGLEFLLPWEDAVYPQDYPPEGAWIGLTGVFETYTEEGDPELYFRLRAEELEVLELPPQG